MSAIQSLRDRMKADQQEVSGLKVKQRALIMVTAGELRAAADENPGHPLAEIKRKSVAHLPDQTPTYHERADIDALLDGGQVVETESIINGSVVNTKKVEGGKTASGLGKQSAAPTPAQVEKATEKK